MSSSVNGHAGLACADARAALSALHDGEDTGVPDSQLAAHLDGCPQCRRWQVELGRAAGGGLAGAIPEAATAPDLTSRVLAAVTADPAARSHSRTQRAQRRVIRLSLAITALGQLILAFPMLAGPMGTAAARMSWEAGALGVAVAVGFGYAAFRPAAAAPMLPIALVVAVLFLIEGARDVIADPMTLAYHTGHLVVLLQLALLWSLARTPLPRRSAARNDAAAAGT